MRRVASKMRNQYVRDLAACKPSSRINDSTFSTNVCQESYAFDRPAKFRKAHAVIFLLYRLRADNILEIEFALDRR